MITMSPPIALYRAVKDFPRYEINELNEVLDTVTNAMVPQAKFDGVSYVELIRDDTAYLMHVNRLRWAAFYTIQFPMRVPRDLQ